MHYPAIEAWSTETTEKLFSELFQSVPASRYQASLQAREISRRLIKRAALQAAMIGGSSALPGPVIQVIAVVPVAFRILLIQAQLVADIAALHGRLATLRQEDLRRFLLSQTGTLVFSALLSRCGRQTLIGFLGKKTLLKIGGQRFIRLLPLAGVVVSAWAAWKDTRNVGRMALDFFSRELSEKITAGMDTGIPRNNYFKPEPKH